MRKRHNRSQMAVRTASFWATDLRITPDKGARDADERRGYGQTNWDDLLIDGIFGPPPPHTPLSCTLLLRPCEVATG